LQLAEGAPDQAEEAEEAYEEGLLLSIDFGDAEHDLYYSNLKESLGGGNPINIRFVEFQRVCSCSLPSPHCVLHPESLDSSAVKCVPQIHRSCWFELLQPTIFVVEAFVNA